MVNNKTEINKDLTRRTKKLKVKKDLLRKTFPGS